MKIDYSKYTAEELLDALEGIDRDSYPDRVKELEARLQDYYEAYEQNVKPTLDDNAIFQLKADEIGAEAQENGHSTEYGVISVAIMFAVFMLSDSISTFALLAPILVVFWFLSFRSNKKDLKIFGEHTCPLCQGELHFEHSQHGLHNSWVMECWSCKKMAPLNYTGFNQSNSN